MVTVVLSDLFLENTGKETRNGASSHQERKSIKVSSVVVGRPSQLGESGTLTRLHYSPAYH